MRILVVEDDPALRLGLRRTLEAEGWQVDVASDGEQALAATATADYAAAVLDLGLPRKGGLQTLRHWRAAGHSLAVLIVTARDGLADRVQGLDSGADDYLTKPFEPAELAARLRAILRRREGRSSNRLVVGGLSYNTGSGELRHDGQPLALTPRESALIELLMARPGEPVAKSRIVTAMSSWETNFSANAVEIYVLKLRRKLAATGVTIRTVRGLGYALEPLDKPAPP